ncbi:unnamed protein product [Arabidopsis lyrata]|nr:unnamed protein product [Arabidopsis lyrata]
MAVFSLAGRRQHLMNLILLLLPQTSDSDDLLLPSLSSCTLAKHGVEKWKSLTEKKKKFYLVKAAQLKAEYNKALENNDANEQVEDEEKQSNEAEEKQADDVLRRWKLENTDDEGKEGEEEILDDY